MSSIECKCDGIKGDNFDGNKDTFLFWTSDSELLGPLEIIILVVADSYKVKEELGCKEGTSLGVYEWSVEGITEVLIIGSIEVSLE